MEDITQIFSKFEEPLVLNHASDLSKLVDAYNTLITDPNIQEAYMHSTFRPVHGIPIDSFREKSDFLYNIVTKAGCDKIHQRNVKSGEPLRNVKPEDILRYFIDYITEETHHGLVGLNYIWDKKANKFEELSSEKYDEMRTKAIYEFVNKAMTTTRSTAAVGLNLAYK